MSNLKQLGTATQMYLGDNRDKVPFTRLIVNSGQNLSWDEMIMTYMGGPSVWDTASNAWWDRGWNYWTKSPPLNSEKGYICPADKLTPGYVINNSNWAGAKRSYSMPQHAMGGNASFIYGGGATDWPPSSLNRCGIGLMLNQNAIQADISR